MSSCVACCPDAVRQRRNAVLLEPPFLTCNGRPRYLQFDFDQAIAVTASHALSSLLPGRFGRNFVNPKPHDFLHQIQWDRLVDRELN